MGCNIKLVDLLFFIHHIFGGNIFYFLLLLPINIYSFGHLLLKKNSQ